MNTGKSVRTPTSTNTGERTSATITASRPLGRSSHRMGDDSIAGSHSRVARRNCLAFRRKLPAHHHVEVLDQQPVLAPPEPKADANDQECCAKERALA